MAIGIDPTVDFACKRLLGSPDHPAITLHFLNAVLGGHPRITAVEILNPIIGKDYDDDKVSILDVLATDNHDRRIDIEIQTTLPAGLPKRLTYYAASQLVEQLGEGDSYRDLRSSIGICILDAILFGESASLHLDFQLRTVSGELLTDCLQIHLLELPKYHPETDNGVIDDPIRQWIHFFRFAATSGVDELRSRLPDPVFAEAIGVLEMIARNPDEKRYYESRLKMQRDEQARLEAAEERGIEKGIERGKELGVEQGKAIGRVQLLQSLVGDTVTTGDDLQTRSLDDLAELESEAEAPAS